MHKKLVAILACGSRKQVGRHTAGQLYTSTAFSLNRAAALDLVDGDAERVWILSALHGLVRSATRIDSYNVKFGDAAAIDRTALVKQILSAGLDDCEGYFYGPGGYFQRLNAAAYHARWFDVHNVFEGNRGIGDQQRYAKLCAA